jgi:hypothetical protein
VAEYGGIWRRGGTEDCGMATDCLGQAEVVALAGACASAQCRNGAREPALEPCGSAELIILILAPVHGHRLQESPHEPGSWVCPAHHYSRISTYVSRREQLLPSTTTHHSTRRQENQDGAGTGGPTAFTRKARKMQLCPSPFHT